MQILPAQPYKAIDHFPLKGGNGHLPGNMKLGDVAMVGSHNAACAKQYGWYYAQQRVTIYQQFLNCGARFFKIPNHWFYAPNGFCKCCRTIPESEQQPYIALAHEPDGRSNCKISIMCRGLKYPQRAITAYEELAQIAEHYPDEAIILKIEDWLYNYRGDENGTKDFSDEKVVKELDKILEESGLKQRAFKLKDNSPTLEEMRQGKNVIIFTDVEEVTKFEFMDYIFYAYKYTAQVNWTEDPFTYSYKKDLAQGRGTYDKQGKIIEPFFMFTLNPEASLSFFPYGAEINVYSQVKKRYEYMKKLYNVYPNILSSDYIDQGSIFSVVDEANYDTMKELKLGEQK